MRPLRWKDQRPGEWVLRLWLGGTFTYAGVYKLTDPGFFDSGSNTYIGTQLEGFAQNSPIGGLLNALADHLPVLAGLGVALTEILVGVATLAGVAPAIAAFVGFGLSVTLWLSATFHLELYFLGSDTIYAVAWLAYLLCLPSTLALIARLRDRSRPGPDLAPDDTRRSALRGGAVVLGGLAVAGVSALVARARDDGTANAATPPASTPRAPATTAPTASASATGAVLASLNEVETAGGVEFQDPDVGESVVCAVGGGRVAAYSLRCTHQGCIANFNQGSRLIVCPCHNSQFDPANGGAPTSGPATRPLTEVPVVVDGDQVRRA